METSLYNQCHSLIAEITAQCTAGSSHGFMSSSIYDTAWLSMLQKPGDAASWLFPQCFDFVLQNQMTDGSWQSYRSMADGILNTVAALLALKKHLRAEPHNQDWNLRCRRAESALENMLNCWNISLTDQVGFELLVIKHLSLLEDEGLVFRFPGLTALRALYDAKLEKLPIYSGTSPLWPVTNAPLVYQGPCTLHHSLEALIGHIDFDQLSRWRQDDGSMLGSVSSTVAYLLNSSAWDEKAESYLRTVLEYGTGEQDGGVPCAWPTTIFEVSWVITTLAEAGVSIRQPESSRIADYLEKALASRNGIIGFSTSTLPDADDTAKTIMALRYLGRPISVNPLLEAFDSGDHFRTYKGERNPSFSANCNILNCLMMVEDPTPYKAQIAKAACFLCMQVFNRSVNEKWHSHELYWMMLLSRTFVQFHHLTREENCRLRDEIFATAPQLKELIPMVSLQVLMEVLSSQEPNGSWGDICEVTAYAVLTLSSLKLLPWVQDLQDDGIATSISRGKSFLQLHREQWGKGHYLWVEKVTYASNILSETYCLAAASVPAVLSHQTPSRHAFLPPTGLTSRIQSAIDLINHVPLLHSTDPRWLKTSKSMAGYIFLFLQHPRLEISLERRDKKRQHRYQIFTPAIWATCNALHGNAISLSALCEMTEFSAMIYQVDEFMESIVEKDFGQDLLAIDRLIRHLCCKFRATLDTNRTNGTTSTSPPRDESIDEHSSKLEDVESVLSRFIKHVLHQQAILNNPKDLQQTLAYELETFLLAHISQARDNQQFSLQQESNSAKGVLPTYSKPGCTFYNWVRNVSANHTSCPLAFIYFICLVSTPYSNLYKTAKTAYLAEDLCRHLASLCRMYNDYGSVSRDNDERNVNSVNFPEFHIDTGDGFEGQQGIKDQLMWIAEYERSGLEKAAEKLQDELGNSDLMKALKVFVDVTDLYGQIYVQSDLTARNR